MRVGPIVWGGLICLLESVASGETSTGQIYAAPFFSVPLLNLTIEPSAAAGPETPSVTYQPSVSPDLGLRIAYGAFGLSFSLPLKAPSSDGESSEAPQSQYWDTKTAFYKTFIGAEAGIHRYQGFGQQATDAEEGSDALPFDLIKRGRYINVLVFPMGNELEFGQRIDENEHEGLRWSPLIQLAYDKMELEAPSPLVPERLRLDYGEDAAMTAISIESYSASGGAAMKYSDGLLQTTFAMTFGRALEAQEFMSVVADHENSQTMAERRSLGKRMSLRWGGDVSVDGWQCGLNILLDRHDSSLAKGTLTSDVGTFVMSVGTTFFSR